MTATNFWPAQPVRSLSGMRVGDFADFTDGSRRQIVKIEHTLVNNRPGDSGEHHVGLETTHLFEPNADRWQRP